MQCGYATLYAPPKATPQNRDFVHCPIIEKKGKDIKKVYFIIYPTLAPTPRLRSAQPPRALKNHILLPLPPLHTYIIYVLLPLWLFLRSWRSVLRTAKLPPNRYGKPLLRRCIYYIFHLFPFILYFCSALFFLRSLSCAPRVRLCKQAQEKSAQKKQHSAEVIPTEKIHI